ncbi:SDR family oxidoreductase [Streptomyces sp. HNM0574]|uniref:SDR family NAD(P)-dependent oxidoreductase n=1 Tax=Streptomyces sp. HNM0574 TaxID=2714954 RepID=UPI00146B25D6|nr:SDR family oxidoreductase [Streptomyces sp. HNM0574]NLU66205.1 SDR family oxidoreductase [Streptomyces sp. HNM0574]
MSSAPHGPAPERGAELAGTGALVTGGASGIGAAVAALFLARGARVAVLDRAPEGAPEGTLALTADLTDDAAVRRAVDRAAAELGGLHTVVANAGIETTGTVEETDDAAWFRMLDVNLLGVVRTDRAALPHLRRAAAERPGCASVVHTCSVAATAGLPRRAAYSAGKGAVLSLTRAMAADHVREGIRVNCVTPGVVDTPWIGRLLESAEDPAAERAALEARQPRGRLVTPEEVAGAVAYLAGPAASAVTGVALPVDSGMQTLRPRAAR